MNHCNGGLPFRFFRTRDERVNLSPGTRDQWLSEASNPKENEHVTQTHPHSRDGGHDCGLCPCLQRGRCPRFRWRRRWLRRWRSGFGGGGFARRRLWRRPFRRRPHSAASAASAGSRSSTSTATIPAISSTGSIGRTGTAPPPLVLARWALVLRRQIMWAAAYAQPVAAYSAPAVSTPGPCTCLTKSYTQDGMVVFADLCTKESAAAPVDGRSAEATPMPPQGLSGPPAPPTLRPLRPRTRRATRRRRRTRRTSPAAPTRTSWRRTVCRCRRSKTKLKVSTLQQGRPRDHRGRLFCCVRFARSPSGRIAFAAIRPIFGGVPVSSQSAH